MTSSVVVRGEAREVALAEAQAVHAMARDEELGQLAGLEPAKVRQREEAEE